MKLLKLVIVDDEPILLQGLVKTYNWNEMGFEVAGQAQSGEQAIEVIKKVKPHVVLTDIRMKQVSGLMVMEEIQKTELDPVFIVLSAYRDFNYAQQACDLGAYAYLLKPIEEDKLQETMQGAYQTCMEKLESEERYESWENMIRKDSTSFLQVVVQKYLQDCACLFSKRNTDITSNIAKTALSFTFCKVEKVNKVLQLKAFMTITAHTAQCKTEQMSFSLFALKFLCILQIIKTTLYYSITVYLRGIIRSSQIIQN